MSCLTSNRTAMVRWYKLHPNATIRGLPPHFRAIRNRWGITEAQIAFSGSPEARSARAVAMWLSHMLGLGTHEGIGKCIGASGDLVYHLIKSVKGNPSLLSNAEDILRREKESMTKNVT
jgi:hypothetical protein